MGMFFSLFPRGSGGGEPPAFCSFLRLFKPFGGLATSFLKRARRDLSVGDFSAPLGATTGLKQNVENQSVTPIVGQVPLSVMVENNRRERERHTDVDPNRPRCHAT